MTATGEAAAIREILLVDPGWSLYALGDLAPGYFEKCEWHRAAAALAAVYRGATPPVLFATGDPGVVAGLVAEIGDPELSLHVRPEVAGAIEPVYRSVGLRPVWRMLLDSARFRPEACAGAARLTAADVAAIEHLFADGRDTHEAPDFFFPNMVTDGVFFGVREGDELVAVAGTHLAVASEGVGAIGNVYTRRDHRGRGLGGALTSAVTSELVAMGIRIVGLNVLHSNRAAARVYERLGFRRYCTYFDGKAVRNRPRT
jgi:ribosomal protein S18 acetylase RimI-like enzyme